MLPLAFCLVYSASSWMRWSADCRGGGTVHPAIPDLRRTYGSVYARFTLGSTPVLRFGFVRFASGLVGIRTGLVLSTGFPDSYRISYPRSRMRAPLALLGACFGRSERPSARTCVKAHLGMAPSSFERHWKEPVPLIRQDKTVPRTSS